MPNIPTNVVRFVGSDDSVDVTWDEAAARIGSQPDHFQIIGMMDREGLWAFVMTAEDEIYVPSGRTDEIDTYMLVWQDLPWVLESLPSRDFARIVAVADRCGFVLRRAVPVAWKKDAWVFVASLPHGADPDGGAVFPLHGAGAGPVFVPEPKPATAEAAAGGWG